MHLIIVQRIIKYQRKEKKFMNYEIDLEWFIKK